MALDPTAIKSALDVYIGPQARGRLLARGLARGMVWKDGLTPEGGQAFPSSLTRELLDLGYGVLGLALELRDANRELTAGEGFETQDALRVAAESIESAVRRGDPKDGDRPRHLVIGAAAFHLAGFAARSYSLLPISAINNHLASSEKALGYLLRGDFSLLREHIIEWLNAPAHSDAEVAAQLLNTESDFGPEDAAIMALAATYHRALGLADTALLFGAEEVFESSVRTLDTVVESAAIIGNVPIWWVAILTLHIFRDLWDQSLHRRLPSGPSPIIPQRWDALRRDFIAQLATRRPPHIELWPSQLTAASRAIDPKDDLVIALPTSAGKTRIAELCILRTLADEKRIVYVTPLRALSAQVERVLARTFIPLGASVTSLYGASGATSVDSKTLVSANIVVSTPEKLDFAIRQDGEVLNDVGLIIFDEGHMIGLGSREVRYEVLIQRLLRRADADNRRIVCLSAMFNPDDPYFKDFGNWLRADAPGDSVHVRWRPTRQRLATLDWNARSSTAMLSFTEGEKPFVPRFLEGKEPQKRRKKPFPVDDAEFCICAANAFARDGHSVLVYSPQRGQVEKLAREFRHMHDQGYLGDVKSPKQEHLSIARAIALEWLGAEHPALLALEVGVGAHHGALPRPFLNAIEDLLDARQLSVVVASPTLAQGIDLACSVLIFRSLRRYENGEWVPISPAEFGNVIGRAGRAHVDLDGMAVLPTFNASDRQAQHRLFASLADKSRGQVLQSGLFQLVLQITHLIGMKLGASGEGFVEYVLNQRDLWADHRLLHHDEDDDDGEDGTEDNLDEHIADLDVAILSLVDQLDAPVEELAAILDDALKDSLWKRTLAHESEEIARLERETLRSRAEWLWRTTNATQRRACFNSGLGRKPGLFIHERLDALVGILTKFQAAVALDNDDEAAADAAIALAESVMDEPFFGVRRLPDDWETVLKAWVKGVAFSEILKDRKARDAQRTQAFVQDGVVFRLVWAVEAVRVQAIATEHPQMDELGDGPAFSLTYGVPRIPAALLCQMGFSSRVGALWVVRMLSATFRDNDGLNEWLREHDALLSDPEFWEHENHYLLWERASTPTTHEFPRRWNHKTHTVTVNWKYGPPPSLQSQLRVIPGNGRSATICGTDLTPLGIAQLPFDPRGAALDAKMTIGAKVRIAYFGRN